MAATGREYSQMIATPADASESSTPFPSAQAATPAVAVRAGPEKSLSARSTVTDRADIPAICAPIEPFNVKTPAARMWLASYTTSTQISGPRSMISSTNLTPSGAWRYVTEDIAALGILYRAVPLAVHEALVREDECTMRGAWVVLEAEARVQQVHNKRLKRTSHAASTSEKVDAPSKGHSTPCSAAFVAKQRTTSLPFSRKADEVTCTSPRPGLEHVRCYKCHKTGHLKWRAEVQQRT
ncbi:hypothetical protein CAUPRSCDRAFT_11955 [Caulochytrium protostelioides]|uniref:Uncharacterized protein n=1 Tax=Caulochytrium protostelioides TaxID=1555241 RepID=A0A4P9WT50_9FUNG|nr:hypothetical protein CAUPRSCDRAFT_11955 [Caulochytrium protostelioides]